MFTGVGALLGCSEPIHIQAAVQATLHAVRSRCFSELSNKPTVVASVRSARCPAETVQEQQQWTSVALKTSSRPVCSFS